jgi:hypothetical protein
MKKDYNIPEDNTQQVQEPVAAAAYQKDPTTSKVFADASGTKQHPSMSFKELDDCIPLEEAFTSLRKSVKESYSA